MLRSYRHIAVVVIVAVAAVNISASKSWTPDSIAFWLGTHSEYPFENDIPNTEDRIVKTPTDGGIREDIPAKYRERFDKWKTELLSTELGRAQWDRYANDKSFILTVTVSGGSKGAGTSDYLWNDEGKLVGATITLSASLEEGSPPPVYYPVLNSVSNKITAHSIGGSIIAATRMSHELGHVNQTYDGSMKVIQMQNKLMIQYNSIFMQNGAKDKKLIDIASQMNGTPVEIWESREYWSEVNAMLYLSQRISKESFYCFVFRRMKRNIETHAKAYEDRFSQHPEFTDSPCWN
ncbi:MAG TPA: hypothetical protein VJV05_08640 [Pyrinomonadaceae bacterium]|nr:hypothetical protein [Pyrinomonadaceae bacterium]